MTILAIGENVCKSALWDRIQGWQVVLAVLIIATVWGIVQVARLHYMVKAATTYPNCNQA